MNGGNVKAGIERTIGRSVFPNISIKWRLYVVDRNGIKRFFDANF